MSDWLEQTEFDTGEEAVTSTDGKGSIAPPIELGIDYYLRDQSNEIITDENGDSISLEGLMYA